MWRIFQLPHNYHTWKAEISPDDNFFSTDINRDIRDKYELCPTVVEHTTLLGAEDMFQLKEHHCFRPSSEYDEGNTGQPDSIEYSCQS